MGISTHSQERTLLIFSSSLEGLSALENAKRHHTLVTALKDRGIPYETVLGRYKGKTETSVVVSAKHMHDTEVYSWAFYSFGQESVLKLVNHKHGMYKAYFAYPASYKEPMFDEEFVGYFRQMSISNIKALDLDYTLFKQGQHFVIWDNDETLWDLHAEDILNRIKAKNAYSFRKEVKNLIQKLFA